MAYQDGLTDAERGQQGVRIRGQLLEAELVLLGLAGFAEADLVRCNHTVAGATQDIDGLLPGAGAEILSVQQDDGAVRNAAGGRCHVEIGHLDVLALGVETIT